MQIYLLKKSSLDMPTPADKIEQLRQQIREHDRQYYVEASPVISDLEYDKLLDRLKSLEAEAKPSEGLLREPRRRLFAGLHRYASSAGR